MSKCRCRTHERLPTRWDGTRMASYPRRGSGPYCQSPSYWVLIGQSLQLVDDHIVGWVSWALRWIPCPCMGKDISSIFCREGSTRPLGCEAIVIGRILLSTHIRTQRALAWKGDTYCADQGSPRRRAAAMQARRVGAFVTFLPLVYLADQQAPTRPGRADMMEWGSLLLL